jgi:hypothetical protein
LAVSARALGVAETITRLGASPPDDESVERLEAPLVELLEPPGSLTRAHDDPDPGRRVMQRMLQRLDGMGKWGGYHTAFVHVARGFAGNERALAVELGERRVASGLLTACCSPVKEAVERARLPCTSGSRLFEGAARARGPRRRGARAAPWGAPDPRRGSGGAGRAGAG